MTFSCEKALSMVFVLYLAIMSHLEQVLALHGNTIILY